MVPSGNNYAERYGCISCCACGADETDAKIYFACFHWQRSLIVSKSNQESCRDVGCRHGIRCSNCTVPWKDLQGFIIQSPQRKHCVCLFIHEFGGFDGGTVVRGSCVIDNIRFGQGTYPVVVQNDTDPCVIRFEKINRCAGIRPEFKEAMDSYEAFYNEYCDFMEEYTKNPTDLTLLSKYAGMISQVEEMDKKFKAWDEGDLSGEELKYYLDVMNRVQQRLLDAF